MLAGAATAEIRSRDQDAGAVEAGVIQGMESAGGLFRDLRIRKRKLAESVEGDALHEAGRDDAVGVDVVSGDEDAASGDLDDFFECHDFRG